MYIVQGEQAEPQDLIRYEEMADVGTRESSARCAVARLIQRFRIIPELGPLDVDPSLGRECRTISTHSGRCDAIKEVDSPLDSFDDVLRESNTHEISRPVIG